MMRLKPLTIPIFYSFSVLAAVFLSLLAVPNLGFAELPAVVAKDVADTVSKELNSLVKLYKHLHTHPELSFQEKETGKKLAGELRHAGFKVTERVGGYGVVGVLTNGPGPTILVRTDLDALPVREETGAAYASTATATNEKGEEVPVMHACGHDVHITTLVGVARVLSKLTKHWRGTVVAIGQPAEERGAGARAMLKDGLYERFPKPEKALALHVDPYLEVGKISYVSGYGTANVDSVDVTVFGKGGHGAYPHKTKDPIVIASQIVVALQTIVSREVKPIDPAVVTVGSIHGGSKHNVIPNEVNLQLTVRTYTDEVRDQVLAAIERISHGIAKAAGLPDELLPKVALAKSDGYTPSGYNTPELAERAKKLFEGMLGAENVLPGEPSMGGEDFALYSREFEDIDGFMFRIGSVATVTESQPSLHSSMYLPEPKGSIGLGVRAMSALVLELLSDAAS